MNARDAIAIARREFTDMFAGEAVSDIGLEEVRFDTAQERWLITLGFSRPWEQRSAGPLANTLGVAIPRTYKIVELADDDGSLLAIRNRDVRAAA